MQDAGNLQTDQMFGEVTNDEWIFHNGRRADVHIICVNKPVENTYNRQQCLRIKKNTPPRTFSRFKAQVDGAKQCTENNAAMRNIVFNEKKAFCSLGEFRSEEGMKSARDTPIK